MNDVEYGLDRWTHGKVILNRFGERLLLAKVWQVSFTSSAQLGLNEEIVPSFRIECKHTVIHPDGKSSVYLPSRGCGITPITTTRQAAKSSLHYNSSFDIVCVGVAFAEAGDPKVPITS
jgi:hypothetical protein